MQLFDQISLIGIILTLIGTILTLLILVFSGGKWIGRTDQMLHMLNDKMQQLNENIDQNNKIIKLHIKKLNDRIDNLGG